MKKVGVLFSAGVESTSLLIHYLVKGLLVYPVYVHCRLSWESTELRYAENLWAVLKKSYRNLMPMRILPMAGSKPLGDSVEIPLRNLILSVGVMMESYRKGIKRVALGSLGIYPFPDNNRNYLDRLEDLISEGARENISLETPFIGMEKWEVVKKFYPKAPYKLTFSCVKPVRGKHCGKCEKCLERKEGFLKAGVPDPTIYVSS